MIKTIKTPIIALLFLAACSTSRNIVETVPLKGTDSLPRRGYVYSLPVTVFRVHLEVIETRTIRGPYYRFADKFLSIKDVPDRSRNEYRISRVQIESIEEADPAHVYLLRDPSQRGSKLAAKPWLTSLLDLGGEGLVYAFQPTVRRGEPLIEPGSRGGPPFTELSMERNTMMSIDTFYKTILTDTSFIRVPVLKEQLMVKTIDEKAEEAADFILDLRYERYMMLTGNNNTQVSDYAAKRLDEIERQYLELFTGKSFEERYRYTFYIIPAGEEYFENYEILEFSEQKGILEEGSPDSEVLSLGIRKTGKTDLLRDPLQPEAWPVLTNALYYRVPDMAEVELSLGGRTLLKDRYPVNQLGEILSMPVGGERKKAFLPLR